MDTKNEYMTDISKILRFRKIEYEQNNNNPEFQTKFCMKKVKDVGFKNIIVNRTESSSDSQQQNGLEGQYDNLIYNVVETRSNNPANTTVCNTD